jgi:hypothetical protein
VKVPTRSLRKSQDAENVWVNFISLSYDDGLTNELRFVLSPIAVKNVGFELWLREKKNILVTSVTKK